MAAQTGVAVKFFSKKVEKKSWEKSRDFIEDKEIWRWKMLQNNNKNRGETIILEITETL